METNNNKTSTKNGIETAPANPGWIKKKVPDEYADEGLQRIILFYVINTPCIELSSSGIDISTYGWSKDVWRNEKLKKVLFGVANLERGKSFVVAKRTTDMKQACKRAQMDKRFHDNRAVERIVIFKNKENEFLSLCSHIRNSLAHGRLAMYQGPNDEIIFALEDGIKKSGYFEVRSRMILKKSTLLNWINIIEAGKISEESLSEELTHV